VRSQLSFLKQLFDRVKSPAQGGWKQAWAWVRPRLSSPSKAWPWALRVTLAVATLGYLAPRPVYVIPDPQQTVQTKHPIVCVHTRLTDEVHEWVIQRSLQQVREMGATTIVEFFPWPYYETSKGQFSWDRADLIIGHARTQGLTVIARLGLAPEWARPDPNVVGRETTLSELEPEHFQDFANFVGEFAGRYQGEVDHLMIWNEPNLAVEWGYREVVPEDYAEMVHLSAVAAREANPDVIILAGALAPTLEPEGSPNGMNEPAFLERFYAAGASPYFDAMAVHAYGLRFPPEDAPAPDVLNFRRAEVIHDIMAENGDGDKPVYITETGWNDHPRWTRAVRPGQRITYTLDGYRYAEENWPWVERMCIWAFRFPRPYHAYPDYFALVTTDFQVKPIYEELQAWARGWPRPYSQ
jgi:hypothetical protein